MLDDLLGSWQRPDGGLIVGFDADDPRGEGAYYTFTPAELDARARRPRRPARGRALRRHRGGRALLERPQRAAPARRGHRRPRARRNPAPSSTTPRRRAPPLARLGPRAAPRASRRRQGARRLERPRPDGARRRRAPARRAPLRRRGAEGRPLPRRSLLGRAVAHSAPRRARGGALLGEGFLDDYALTALGLLRLHAADGDLAWLAHAAAIASALVERFHDEAARRHVCAGALPTRPRAPPGRRARTLLPRGARTWTTGVLPSGGSGGRAAPGARWARIAGDRRRSVTPRPRARSRRPQRRVRVSPFSAGFFLVALDLATAGAREVVIAGDPARPADAGARRRARPRRSDARVLPALRPAAGGRRAAHRAARTRRLAGKTALHERRDGVRLPRTAACEAPSDDPTALRKKLAALIGK